jgi:hypothetical protein
MELKLNDVHEVALMLMEETEHIPLTAKPKGHHGWRDYWGWKAHLAAFKAFHQRNQDDANGYLETATKYINQYRGDK